jgi:transposase
MGRNLKIELEKEQSDELENGYRHGQSHAFRQRCRMIMLKSTHMLSKDICDIVGIKSEHQINKWIKLYQNGYKEHGIQILHNKPGQGRKATFDKEKDKERVRAAVRKERQRLSQAQLILEKEMDKRFHLKTLQRFLKSLSADINASESG